MSFPTLTLIFAVQVVHTMITGSHVFKCCLLTFVLFRLCYISVSIARRLQDPLAELVKIDAKHIGVGLYQHDCNETKLRRTLDDVTSECVSFTGVDLNTCSEYLLRKMAGLDVVLARRVVEFRETHGFFVNREQLKSIARLGEKRFQQCAGFVRILPQSLHAMQASRDEEGENSTSVAPSSSTAKRRKVDVTSRSENPLDRTTIHPESYEHAQKSAYFCNDWQLNMVIQLRVCHCNNTII